MTMKTILLIVALWSLVGLTSCHTASSVTPTHAVADSSAAAATTGAGALDVTCLANEGFPFPTEVHPRPGLILQGRARRHHEQPFICYAAEVGTVCGEGKNFCRESQRAGGGSARAS
jgi:hypothetical protein